MTLELLILCCRNQYMKRWRIFPHSLFLLLATRLTTVSRLPSLRCHVPASAPAPRCRKRLLFGGFSGTVVKVLMQKYYVAADSAQCSLDLCGSTQSPLFCIGNLLSHPPVERFVIAFSEILLKLVLICKFGLKFYVGILADFAFIWN